MSAPHPISVIVIDDQSILRAGFRHLLEDVCGFRVVADASCAKDGIALVKDYRPDIVTLDVTMPGLSGIDAIPKIQAVSPRTKIIMLTSHESGRFLEEALKAGATGFLTKDSEPEELKVAITAVHGGRCYVTPRVTATIVNRLTESDGVTASSVPEGAPALGRLGSLSPREREVFQLLAVGSANKEIARDLSISPATVKKHRENLQRKLDAHSPAELARIAIQEGLLPGH